MALSPPGDIEDLTLCSVCKLSFNDGDQLPKLLACKHHFCLKCISSVLLKGRELYCPYCWKRTELPDLRPEALPTYGPILALVRRLAVVNSAPMPTPLSNNTSADVETCPTHGMPHSLWCLPCARLVCRACASHPDHLEHAGAVKPHAEARLVLRQDMHGELALMQKMLADIQRLAKKQREFLLRILEACTTLKTQVETDLVNNTPGYQVGDVRDSLQEGKNAYANSEALGPPEVHRLLSALIIQRERLQAKHREMFLQCKLDDLIKNSNVLFDFDLLKRALAAIHSGENNSQADADGHNNPILFLANYCMSQLYSRHLLFKQQQTAERNFLIGQNGDSTAEYHPGMSLPPYVPLAMPTPKNNHIHQSDSNLSKSGNLNSFVTEQQQQNNQLSTLNMSKASPIGYVDGNVPLHSPNMNKPPSNYHTDLLLPPPPHSSSSGPMLMPPPLVHHSPQATLVRNPSQHIYPVYYFNIEINGSPFGRILIEVRNDVAPKMAKNFGILTTGELGIGYRGCSIFQCWENESIITGDFELNSGRGGRSVFDESFFMPDDTKILAIRGSVGMRRSQKRHDNMGLVGSQFRIILREMRGFTGIFAFVVEGLELVDRISQSGDSAGKPQSNILIASCGKLN